MKNKKTKVIQACIVRQNNYEACSDQIGADTSSHDSPHEGVFIQYTQPANGGDRVRP